MIDNGKVKISLYDKRKHFKVIILTNFNSNLYSKFFNNTFYNQFNRIRNICNTKDNFIKAIDDFYLNNNNFNYYFCNFKFLVKN